MQIQAFHRDTGKRVACIQGVSAYDAGLCLRAALADRFECDINDLSTQEDDEGQEFITVPTGDVLRVEW